MEDIESELEQKSVERVEATIVDIDDDTGEENSNLVYKEEPVKPKKTKRVRSEAQKAAFERAKLKRAENIKKRKEDAAQKKLEKKVTKTQIKERVKEELQKETKVKEVTAIPTGPQHAAPLQRQTSVRDNPQGSSVREQVVQNHYYYYGMPPPSAAPVQESEPPKRKKKGKKVKRPPTPSSSSEEEHSDVEEPETYQEQYKEPEPQPVYYEEPKKQKFKFGYV